MLGRLQDSVPPMSPELAAGVIGGELGGPPDEVFAEWDPLPIAAASIVAKVVRDRLMARLAVRFPGYGWERNAGYPTVAHRAALRLLGPTRHHRAGFGTVRQLRLLD